MKTKKDKYNKYAWEEGSLTNIVMPKVKKSKTKTTKAKTKKESK